MTKVRGDSKGLKERLVAKVQAAAEEHSTLMVFRCTNVRSQVIHAIRDKWADSKIFFGKNKVVQVALGRTPADEVQDNMHKVSERLRGACMLLFTNRDRREVEDFFANFHEREYARMGMLVTQDVEIKEGPLTQFAHSQEPYLRGLGLPTRLNRAVVTLERDFQICRKGDKLTSEQARLLKAFGLQLAEVNFSLDSVWRQGRFELVGDMDLGEDEEEVSGDSMDEGNDAMDVDNGNNDDNDEEEEEVLEQPAPQKKLRAQRRKK